MKNKLNSLRILRSVVLALSFHKRVAVYWERLLLFKVRHAYRATRSDRNTFTIGGYLLYPSIELNQCIILFETIAGTSYCLESLRESGINTFDRGLLFMDSSISSRIKEITIIIPAQLRTEAVMSYSQYEVWWDEGSTSFPLCFALLSKSKCADSTVRLLSHYLRICDCKKSFSI